MNDKAILCFKPKMSCDSKIKVGSRKSELALIQTNHVINLLRNVDKTRTFEVETMNTLGDKVLDIPLPKIGQKSLFTKELESALENGIVDFVVHSLKDLPTALPEGMAIGAVLEREDPRDALVLQKNMKNEDLDSLPRGSVIGTSSLRRAAQLSRKYPQLKVENIRGNLNTRLYKLDESGKFQAIVLATAGLQRMGWHNRISKIIPTNELMYAVGQGAIAVECREDDIATIEMLQCLYDAHTALRVITERAFLCTLGGGCSAPVASCTEITHSFDDKHKLSVIGAVWSLDGKEELVESGEIELTLGTQNFVNSNICPYKNKCKANVCIKNEVVPIKRMKINNQISADLFNDDVHDHCPVPIPIGADFMGQCPYLELSPIKKHINVDVAKSGSLDVSKCPYFKENEVAQTSVKKDATINQKISGKKSNLYCGMVPHPDLPIEVMESAYKLGTSIAEKLIAKGALEIISKAQAYIHKT